MTGSVDAAIRGDMPMFVGGDDADIVHVRPVIEAMGQLRKVGRYGNGDGGEARQQPVVEGPCRRDR